MEEVDESIAEVAWLVYDLQFDSEQNRYRLSRSKTVFTRFENALERITRSEPGDMNLFVEQLQERLDAKLEGVASSDAPSLNDILDTGEL